MYNFRPLDEVEPEDMDNVETSPGYINIPPEQIGENITPEIARDRYKNAWFGRGSKVVRKWILAPSVLVCFVLLLLMLFYFLSIASPPVGRLVYKNPHPVTTMGLVKTVKAYSMYIGGIAGKVVSAVYGDLDVFQKWVAGLLTLFVLSALTVYFWNKVELKGLADGLVWPLIRFGFKFGVLALLVFGIYKVFDVIW